MVMEALRLAQEYQAVEEEKAEMAEKFPLKEAAPEMARRQLA